MPRQGQYRYGEKALAVNIYIPPAFDYVITRTINEWNQRDHTHKWNRSSVIVALAAQALGFPLKRYDLNDEEAA